MRERRIGWEVAAFIWGLAEATVFPIVPDVLLTALAVRAPGRALRACGFAVAGAVVGGIGMANYAAGDPEGAAQLVLAVPGVSEALAERARGLVAEGYLAGMTAGALSGVPYRLFAVEAGAAGVGLAGFAAASAVARSVRFVLVVGVTTLVARQLLRGWGERAKYALLAAVWAGFYAFYFAAVGW